MNPYIGAFESHQRDAKAIAAERAASVRKKLAGFASTGGGQGVSQGAVGAARYNSSGNQSKSEEQENADFRGHFSASV
jgi:hypothetical protein